MSSQSAIPSAAQFVPPVHLHLDNDECPSCGQVIPPEKVEEIKGKIASKERERTVAITATLESRFEQERAAAEHTHKLQLAEWQQSLTAAADARKAAEDGNATLKAQLLKVQQDNVAAIEAAKAAARRDAEEAAASKLTELQTSHRNSEVVLQARITQAEEAASEARAATKQAVDAAVAEKLAEAQILRTESEAAFQARITQAEEAAAEARAATKQTVDAAVAEKLAEAQALRTESEAALQARITQAEEAAAEARAATKQTVDAAVAEKLAEAQALRTESEAALQARITQAEAKATLSDEAVAAANAKASQAEVELSALKEQQAAALAKTLDEQREVLEKAKEDALNAQAAKSFDENQKLSVKVNELTRALEKKTNEELGEGAEVDLYEALRKEFPEDRITRVKKGEPGGDILHVVVVQGRDCGKIIYDSKNHKQYRAEHVAKLKVDQLGADAEHAILSTHKFPQGKGQLHMIDGVLLANPARVVLLTTLVRRHLIQVHSLRLSSIERDSKTEALYTFITSDKCSLLFERIDGSASELLKLQEKEIAWHKNNWRKQGETVRAIQKTNAELENEISTIVGTAAEDDDADEALEGVEALEA